MKQQNYLLWLNKLLKLLLTFLHMRLVLWNPLRLRNKRGKWYNLKKIANPKLTGSTTNIHINDAHNFRFN